MKSKTQFQNLFIRIINTPIRLLSKARDVYVRKMRDYADRVSYGDFGCLGPGGQFSVLPRSFSTAGSMRSSTGDEDFRELIRAASARTFGDRIDVDAILKQQLRMRQSRLGPKVLPRSCSAGMGRIDEGIPSDFQDNKDVLMYRRSRSYAVSRTSGVPVNIY